MCKDPSYSQSLPMAYSSVIGAYSSSSRVGWLLVVQPMGQAADGSFWESLVSSCDTAV